MAWMGGLIVALLMVPLADRLGGGDKALGYQRSMMVLGVISGVMFLLCFAGTRERVRTAAPTKRSILADLSALRMNDQLQLVCAAQIFLLIGIAGRGTSTVYFAHHVLGLQNQSNAVTAFVTVGMVGLVIGGLGSAAIERVVDKRTAASLLQLLAGVCAAVTLFVPAGFVEVMFILHFVWSVFIAATVPMVWAMVTDTVDYGAHRAQRRLTGLVFAVNLFAVKLGFAIGGAAVGWYLEAAGYQGSSAIQSASAVHGILTTYAALPAITAISVALILRYYRLDRDRVEDLAAQLKTPAIS